jgi:hypothetical protein
VVELEAENAELGGDVARAEAQLALLKDELRGHERAERRGEVAADPAVCARGPQKQSLLSGILMFNCAALQIRTV